MKGNRYIFYTPEKQYPGMPHGEMCGDIMPFYWEGKYTLFFLYKYCIYAVETTDFVHYGDYRLVLQNGSPDEQDWHAATGSVFHWDGIFYFYYTGFCESNRGIKGKHEQAILRATSTDLYTWEKDKEYIFYPDTKYYGELHWRDPHVFWNEELQKFCMLVTGTTKGGTHQRGGCTAVYISDDVRQWKHYKTIYAPDIYPTHECADAFQMGNNWYLTFSTYSRQWETRYRYASAFEGPWQTPEADDMFDGREFYAAKTVTDGKNRYLVGWQSIRKDCNDDGRFVWGGNVIVHKLCQRADKSLGVEMVDEVRNSFQIPFPLKIETMLGSFELKEALYGKRLDGFGWAQIGELSGTMLFQGRVEWEEGTRALGVMLHTSGANLEKWCQLRIEPGHGKLLMERYNRIDGDQTYLEERSICFDSNWADVHIIISGTIIQSYVNDVALTTRCYSVQDGGIGVFVECGSTRWSDMELLMGQEG